MQPSLRGQRTNEFQLLTDAPVGIYVGEIQQPRPYGLLSSLFDVGSIQVLKGVQGTLFGRNMTGGAILISPNEPSFQNGGQVTATVGNYGEKDLQFTGNAKLSDVVALRVAGKTARHDGYVTDTVNGAKYDDEDSQAIRVSLLVNPTKDIESLFIYDNYLSDTTGPTNTLTDVAPPGSGKLTDFYSAGIPGVTDIQAIAAQAKQFGDGKTTTEMGKGGSFDIFGKLYAKVHNWGISNRTTIDFDGVTFKNVIGTRGVKYGANNDIDGSAAPLIAANQQTSINQISEEMQLQGAIFDDRLEWVTGLFYFVEEGDDGSVSSQFPEFAIFRIDPRNALGLTPTNLLSSTRSSGEATSAAIYASGTYTFTDELSVTIGLRETRDKREVTVRPTLPNFFGGVCNWSSAPTPLSQCAFSNDKAWNALTWDATLQYKPDTDTMAYASIRQGFRAGGFSLRATSTETLKPFDPEYVREYEIGLKRDSSLAGRSLRTNIAAFYQDYKDVQKQAPMLTAGGTVATVITNAASQENYGGELEMNYTVSDNFQISAFGSLVLAHFLTGRDVVTDSWATQSPKYTYGTNLQYTVPLGDQNGDLLLIGSFYRQGLSHLDNADTQADQAPYSLVNVRSTWREVMGSNFDLSAFVNNLTDRKYAINTLSLQDSVGITGLLYGAPRTFGLDVTYKFGSGF